MGFYVYDVWYGYYWLLLAIIGYYWLVLATMDSMGSIWYYWVVSIVWRVWVLLGIIG